MNEAIRALALTAAALSSVACGAHVDVAPPPRAAAMTVVVVESHEGGCAWALPYLRQRFQEDGYVVARAASDAVDFEVIVSGDVQRCHFMAVAGNRVLHEGTTFNSEYGGSTNGWVDALHQSPVFAGFANERAGSPRPVERTAVAPGEQAAEARSAPESEAPFVAGQAQPDAYALVIGIERYRDVPAPVGARRDAERFAQLATRSLGVPADHVRLALDERASRGDLDKHLRWITQNVPEGGRVYFFYAGHGTPDASEGSAYLLPYDGDPKYVAETALPLSEVLDELRQSPAGDVVAFVDACFSGAGGRSVLPEGARPLVRTKPTPSAAGVAVFSASSSTEISGPVPGKKEGLFTSTLVDAIGTAAADQNGDGRISLRELESWVAPRVRREANKDNREQTPTLVVGPGLAPESVVVTRLK